MNEFIKFYLKKLNNNLKNIYYPFSPQFLIFFNIYLLHKRYIAQIPICTYTRV